MELPVESLRKLLATARTFPQPDRQQALQCLAQISAVDMVAVRSEVKHSVGQPRIAGAFAHLDVPLPRDCDVVTDISVQGALGAELRVDDVGYALRPSTQVPLVALKRQNVALRVFFPAYEPSRPTSFVVRRTNLWARQALRTRLESVPLDCDDFVCKDGTSGTRVV